MLLSSCLQKVSCITEVWHRGCVAFQSYIKPCPSCPFLIVPLFPFHYFPNYDFFHLPPNKMNCDNLKIYTQHPKGWSIKEISKYFSLRVLKWWINSASSLSTRVLHSGFLSSFFTLKKPKQRFCHRFFLWAH